MITETLVVEPRGAKVTRWLARTVPHFRGRSRMILGIARLLNGHITGLAVYPLSSRASAYVDLSDPNYWAMYFLGEYEPEVDDAIRRSLAPGDAFIDCGANVGLYSSLASGIVRPSGTVVAFEPLEELAAIVEANFALNGFVAGCVIRAAVGEATGTAVLHRGDAESRGHTTLSPASESSPAVAQCAVVRLDDAIKRDEWPRVKMIKLDVEGGELPALKGASALLAQALPNLIIEINPATAARAGYAVTDIADFLTKRGYRAYVHRGARWHLLSAVSSSLVANVLFVHETRDTPATAQVLA